MVDEKFLKYNLPLELSMNTNKLCPTAPLDEFIAHTGNDIFDIGFTGKVVIRYGLPSSCCIVIAGEGLNVTAPITRLPKIRIDTPLSENSVVAQSILCDTDNSMV